MDRPILFKGEMVKALLAGRKTQTRRVIDFKGVEQAPGRKGEFYFRDRKDRWVNATAAAMIAEYCPYGRPGDRLWVRKTYNPGLMPERSRADGYQGCVYRADEPGAIYVGGWTPSIFMPRRHSRITLEVVNIRVERVHSITEKDALAEGCKETWDSEGDLEVWARDEYAILWDEINAARGFGWDVNPWVWVVEFKVQ